MSEYRYYIATAGSPLTSWTEIFLSNEVEATKKLYEDEKFSREELSDLKIRKSKNSAFCTTLESWWSDATKFDNEIGVEVYRGARSGGDRYFKGFASISDMTYEKEKAYFEFSPRVDDDYREILALKDVEYDIKGIPTGLTAMVIGSSLSITWGAGSIGGTYRDFDAWAASGGVIATCVDSSPTALEARYFPIGIVATGDGFLFNISSLNLNGGNAPYIDLITNADFPISNEGAIHVTANGDYVLTTTTGGFAAYALLYTTVPLDVSMTIKFYKAEAENINPAIKWMDFLEFFVTDSNFMNLTGFTGKVLSTFLNDDSVPTAGPATIATWMTSYPAGNYASVLTDSNPLTSFLISETELWCDASTNEFKLSFSDIMNDIRETLQAWWYIDESGNLRIEHLSWFEYLFTDSTGVILTSSTYAKYRPFSDAEKFTFNKSKLSSREQFTWPQVGSGSTNFKGKDIIYDNLETVENIEKHEPSRVTTDLQYVIDNSADANGDGYLYLHTLLRAGYDIVQREASLYSGGSLLNNHFSWGNLHPRYWMWGRSSQNGTMNGAATSFNSAIRFMEQTVKFGYQSTLDIFERIITDQGNGFQLETKRNLDTDMLTIKLGYDPYA